MANTSNIVSFDNEPLMLVDNNDVVIGFEEKTAAHRGNGVLHRAFSIFLFNDHGEVLLQQRSSLKPLWPEYWSNTCCSHPRRGESLAQATERRLKEESQLTFLFKFQYHAVFNDIGSEHELCSVFVGKMTGRPEPDFNPTEIATTAWVSVSTVDEWLTDVNVQTTPWFAMEWQRMKDEFSGQLPLSA